MGKRKKPSRPGAYPKIKAKCPLLYRLLTSPPSTLFCLKMLVGLVFGACIGIALQAMIIASLKLDYGLKVALSYTLMVSALLGCAFSIQVRCIAALLIPTIIGKSGRTYLWAFIIAAIIAGPVTNIIKNGGEVSRSITCTIQLTRNHSQDRAELLHKPMEDVMSKMQEEAKDIHKTAARLKKDFQPVEIEVESQDEVPQIQKEMKQVDGAEANRASRIDKKYSANRRNKPAGQQEQDQFARKLDYRCEEVFSLGVVHCREVFAATYQKCRAKVKVVGVILCLPLKLTVLCNIVTIIPKLAGINCNSMEAINKGFGNGFVTAKESVKSLDKAFDVKMQYQVFKGDVALHRRTVDDITAAVQEAFESRKRLFGNFASLFSKFMAFMFLRVLYSAYKYHKRYVTDLNYDNMYLSNYFRWLDIRRRYMSKKTLMPFKKLEEDCIIKSGRITLTSDEKKKMFIYTVVLGAEAIASALMLFIDKVIFEILDLIRRHSQIDYRQRGTHHISLVVEGNGSMARLVRSLLSGFDKRHDIDSFTSNAECLPRATVTSQTDVYMIFGLIFLAWVFTVFESYSLRLRHIIAGFYYPRRDKRRTLYLYNDLMRKRKGYLKLCRQKAREKAKEKKLKFKMSLLTTLRYKFPRLCGCLSSCGAKKTCLICEEKENARSIRCKCKVVYCTECWRDVGMRCYFCETNGYMDTESDEDLAAQLALHGQAPPPFMELPSTLLKDMPRYRGPKPPPPSSDSSDSENFSSNRPRLYRKSRRKYSPCGRTVLPQYIGEPTEWTDENTEEYLHTSAIHRSDSDSSIAGLM